MTQVLGVVGVLAVLTLVAAGAWSQAIATDRVCPPKFAPIGRKCYHFSKDDATWQDAHFKCLNLNSTLAVVVTAHQELLMRQYINKNREALGTFERWIGGMFNWKQSRWIWGATGKPLVFHGFSRMNSKLKDLWKWHCIIIDPSRQNKWGARNCAHEKRYVCQTPIDKFKSPRATRVKKEFERKNCNNSNLSQYEKELCFKEMRSGNEISPGFLVQKPKKKTVTYVYHDFICPSHMILVGRKCYFFSTTSASWHDAYWACRDNNTKLAVVANKIQDNILRGFLNQNYVEKQERWIGGAYDWKQNNWKWAMTGQKIKYKNFAKPMTGDRAFHCITIDPRFDHMWSSRNRFESNYFICQAKPKTVGKYDKTKNLKPDATVLIQFGNQRRTRAMDNILPTSPTYLSTISSS